MNTTANAPRTTSRVCLSEARKSALDCFVALIDALYYFCMYELPARKKAAWAYTLRIENRFATRLFADEPWETKRDEYRAPSYVPTHCKESEEQTEHVPYPAWVDWLVIITGPVVAGWLFYLWPELFMGVMAVTVGVIGLLARRK